jgi:hypothetical protein
MRHPVPAREVEPSRESNVGGEMLPRFDYYLDESDPDIAVLRRQDDTLVTAFSARGATRKGIVEAAREDYQQLMEVNTESLGLRENGHRRRSA